MMIRKLRDVTIDSGPTTIYDPQLGVLLVLGGATLLLLLLLIPILLLPLLDLQHVRLPKQAGDVNTAFLETFVTM